MILSLYCFFFFIIHNNLFNAMINYILIKVNCLSNSKDLAFIISGTFIMYGFTKSTANIIGNVLPFV